MLLDAGNILPSSLDVLLKLHQLKYNTPQRNTLFGCLIGASSLWGLSLERNDRTLKSGRKSSSHIWEDILNLAALSSPKVHLINNLTSISLKWLAFFISLVEMS